jgi:hypothetical protein
MEIPKSVPELMAQIVALSGVGEIDVPVGKVFCWFSDGSYDEHGKLKPPWTFRLGERSPFNTRMMIVGMFQDDVEARVYAVPCEKPQDGEDVAFTRHTLSKTAPTFFFELLPPGVFQAVVADELKMLAEETAIPSDFEDEDDQPAGPPEETTAPAS